MEHTFKLLDFNIINEKRTDVDDNENEDDDNNNVAQKDMCQFVIQMFGLNAKGKSASITINDYNPFFYLKVGNDWTKNTKEAFLKELKSKVGKYYENSIVKCKLIERNKLYEFDAGKNHRFIEISFSNIAKTENEILNDLANWEVNLHNKSWALSTSWNRANGFHQLLGIIPANLTEKLAT
jgi:hypothetical protein